MPEWEGYANFCSEYERGLRRDAFAILERFMFSLERATFAERQSFVSWLCQQVEGGQGRHMLVPHPLYIRIVEPTLLEWMLIESECSEPHRWLGGEEHLRKAIELDPNDELARQKLIVFILGRVGFNSHELPAGYLGIAQDDLAALNEAEVLLQGLSNYDDRIELAAEIDEERRLIQEHLDGR